MSGTGLDMMSQVIPALAVVLGLPLGVYWWARKGRTSSPARLRVADKAAFGKHSWVAVIEIDGRRFLVGAGEQGVNVISELDAVPVAEPVADSISMEADTETEWPRTGLIRRLQQLTARPARSPWKPLRDAPR